MGSRDENERKHGISFQRAATVFEDALAASIYDDASSSSGEDRWVTMGLGDGMLLVVVHTYQEIDPEHANIRIISARPATARERRQYEGEP